MWITILMTVVLPVLAVRKAYLKVKEKIEILNLKNIEITDWKKFELVWYGFTRFMIYFAYMVFMVMAFMYAIASDL